MLSLSQAAKSLGTGSITTATSQKSRTLEFYFIKDKKFKGEINNALGVANALTIASNYDPSLRGANQGWDITEYQQLVQFLITRTIEAPTTELVVYGVGISGLNILDQLASHEPALKDNLTLVWGAHQECAGLERLFSKTKIMALPMHAISAEFAALVAQSTTQLAPTIGVPHNVTKESIKEQYRTWMGAPALTPIPDGIIFAVMLGGSATNRDGKRIYPDKREPVSLANHIANEAIAFGATVVLTNGPRTGKFKFNPATNADEELKTHLDPSKFDDEASLAFEAVLKKRKVPYVAYNYVDGYPSAFQAILYAVLQQSGRFYISGCSTTNISEADLLPKSSLYVYQTASMTPTHQAHVLSVVNGGVAHGLALNIHGETLSFEEITPTATTSETKEGHVISAAKTLALAIENVVFAHAKLVSEADHASSPKPPQL